MNEVPDVNNQTAETSAAAVAETPTFNPSDQHTWSPEQREHWNKTGNVPEAPKKAQESATANEDEKSSEGKPKTAAESETAPKQEKRERKPGEKLSAEERISQQTAKIRELEAKLAEASKSVTKPTPTEDKPKAEEAPKAPKRPNPFTWTGTPEEFEAAQDAYEVKLREIAAQDALRKKSEREQAKELQAKVDDARKLYADADTRILPTAEKLEKAQIPAAVKAVIEDSEILPHLLYALGDGDTMDKLIEMSRTNPRKAIRVAMDMERDIEAALSKPATSKADESEAKPPVEPKPRAPKPPSEVGGRSAGNEDGLVTAARANSFRDFEREMNARLRASK